MARNATKARNGERSLSRVQIARGIRRFVAADTLSAVGMNLHAGPIRTAFARLLGASDVGIGIMGALPGAIQVIQLFAPYFIQRLDRRKPLVRVLTASSYAMWLPIALIPFYGPAGARVPVFLVLLGVSSILLALQVPAALSWLSDVVPKDQLGRYYGRVGIIGGGLSVLAGLLARAFIDRGQALDADAVEALGKIQAEAAYEHLIRVAAETGFERLARLRVITALGERSGPEEIPEQLLHLLERETDPVIRAACAEGLGKWREARALPLLHDLMGSLPNEVLAKQVAHAIAGIFGEGDRFYAILRSAPLERDYQVGRMVKVLCRRLGQRDFIHPGDRKRFLVDMRAIERGFETDRWDWVVAACARAWDLVRERSRLPVDEALKNERRNGNGASSTAGPEPMDAAEFLRLLEESAAHPPRRIPARDSGTRGEGGAPRASGRSRARHGPCRRPPRRRASLSRSADRDHEAAIGGTTF